MKKIASIATCAAIAVFGFSPAAFAKHKHHHVAAAVVAPVVPVGNPVMDAKGEFYATPVSSGPASAAVLGVPVPGVGGPVPGLDVVGGVAQPVLAIPGAALAVPGQILPGLVPTP